MLADLQMTYETAREDGLKRVKDFFLAIFAVEIFVLIRVLRDRRIMRKQGEKSVPRVGQGVFVFISSEDRRFLLGLRKGSIGAGGSPYM